jgi:uncharacterized membrane protein YcaP (DUF421 family)
MKYADIFTVPDWEPIAVSILQTATIFCLIMIGLQLVGRRVFSQRGPQDLVIIVLVAESCDLGLTHEDAGFWGTIASVLTLFFLGYLTESIPFIRRLLNEKPVILYKDGILQDQAMKKYMVDIEDLEEVAREEGKISYKDFEMMLLEGSGQISAIEKDQKG